MSRSLSVAARLATVALVAGATLTTGGCVIGGSSETKPSAAPSGPTPQKWADSVCPVFADALLAPEAFGEIGASSSPEAAKVGWQRAAGDAIETYDKLLDVLDQPTPALDNAPEVVGVMKATFGALRSRMVAIRDDAAALDTSDQAAFAAGAQKIVDSLTGAQTDINKLDELDRVDSDGKVSKVLEKNRDCAALSS